VKKYFTQPELQDLKWVAIDVDGTIAEPSWVPGELNFVVGAPIAENIKKLEQVVEAGYKIVLYTARPWSHQQLLEAWCEKHIPQIPIRAIICGKLLFIQLVDDRAINAMADSWVPGLVSKPQVG